MLMGQSGKKIMHMRHIIIHYHIFKNAGSTIDAILRNNFGAFCGGIEGNNPWDTLDAASLLQYVLDNPNLKVVSSHQARLPVPDAPGVLFYPLAFLRHPIDRVGSVYLFERRQPKNSPGPGIKAAHENDIKGYVKWRLTDGNGTVIRNFQTVHLSGREKDMRTAIANEADLEGALRRLNALEFFGIVELFQDSVFRMMNYLAREFGNLDTSFTVENRSIDRKNTLEERLDELKAALGRSLYCELLDKNALDIELYNSAVSIFQSRAR